MNESLALYKEDFIFQKYLNMMGKQIYHNTSLCNYYNLNVNFVFINTQGTLV